MRTTVTLEEDVERMLKDEMHRSRQSFKETLNAVLRSGLMLGRSKSSRRVPFKVKARALGLRAGIDSTSFNKLADELELDAVLAKTQPARK